MNKYKFYDTSSLLLLTNKELQEHFIISSITLAELENIKTAYNNADPSKSLLARSVNGIKTGATKLKNNIDLGQIGKTAMTAASIGVGYSQVISSNKQYKDSVRRTDAYNAALKAEEDAATAAQNQATAEYNTRYDSYTAALNQSSTSSQNIYSSGYAGDSIFSSTLKNPRYTLF